MRTASTITMLALAATACRDRNSYEDTAAGTLDSPAAAAATIPAEAPPVTIVTSERGGTLFLTDGTGRAFYIADATPTDTTGTFMPAKGKAVSGATEVKGELIGTTTLPDGTLQITYAGQPLYLFVDDISMGDTKGQGKTVGGTTFNLVDPSGKKNTKK